MPEKDFVEGYIKAYYLPECQFDSWLLDHKVNLYISNCGC